jgi:hypothetical protein
MNTQLTSTARRIALTLGVAGIAALGTVAAAPAALAAPAASVQAQADNNGPDMFLDHYVGGTVHGKVPVFLCDDENEHKQHNNCIDVTSSVRF